MPFHAFLQSKPRHFDPSLLRLPSQLPWKDVVALRLDAVMSTWTASAGWTLKMKSHDWIFAPSVKPRNCGVQALMPSCSVITRSRL